MLYTTPLPKSGNRLDDKIDLAIIEIEEPIAAKIKAEYKFIQLEDIAFGHIVDHQSRYLSFGYLITKTKKIWGENQLKSKPFAAVLKANANFNYEKFGFSLFTHLAIEFGSQVVSENNQNIHL